MFFFVAYEFLKTKKDKESNMFLYFLKNRT